MVNAFFIRLLYLFFLTIVYGGFVHPGSSSTEPKILDVRKSLTRLSLSDLLLFDTHAFVGFYLYYRSVSGLRSARASILRFRGLGDSSLMSYRVRALPSFLKKFLSSFTLFALATLVLVYAKLAVELVPLAKLLFSWGSLFFFSYLLVSGFVFFLKRYAFGRFTTVISRFWKRSFSIFWLLEGYVFACFIYLTLNSSSEVLYFYDYQSIFKTHLFSFRLFFFKLTAISMLMLLTFFLVGNLSFLKESSISLLGTLVSSLLLYIFWVEFLQFFHFASFVEFFSWSPSGESLEWSLESEGRKSRIANNYVLVCVGAKFLHLIVIVLMWFFSFNRMLERPDSREYLLSANLQNFVIMYMLNWIAMYPWFKFIFRKYMSSAYF